MKKHFVITQIIVNLHPTFNNLNKNIINMSNNKPTKPIQNESAEKVGEAVSATESFFEKNKKKLLYGMFAVIFIVAAILLIHRYLVVPKQKEAVDQTFVAEQNFRNDKFDVALNGDGNNLGFKQIIDQYGKKAGEAVYFYAGVCELQLGKYKEAIKYLQKYNGKDEIINARAIACIGDAYAGLKDYSSATSHFEKAAKSADNIFAAKYLMKAGIIYEEMGNKDKALKMYKEIEQKYPQSPEGYEIGKYISRIEIEQK